VGLIVENNKNTPRPALREWFGAIRKSWYMWMVFSFALTVRGATQGPSAPSVAPRRRLQRGKLLWDQITMPERMQGCANDDNLHCRGVTKGVVAECAGPSQPPPTYEDIARGRGRGSTFVFVLDRGKIWTNETANSKRQYVRIPRDPYRFFSFKIVRHENCSFPDGSDDTGCDEPI